MEGRARAYAHLAPFLTPSAAVAVGLVALFNYWHRRKTENRAAWWQRVQYAIDLILQHDEPISRNVGMELIQDLAEELPSVPDEGASEGEMEVDGGCGDERSGSSES